MTRWRRVLAAVGAVSILAVSAPPAHAHGDLESGSPGPGDRVAAGSAQVRLDFDRIDEDQPAYVVVLDADEEPVAVGDATAADDRTVCAATSALEPGVHTVEYFVSSTDGHGFEGRYSFEVAADGEDVAPGPCGTVDLAAAEQARTMDDFTTGGLPGWAWPVLWVVLGVMLLGSVALAGRRLVAERRAAAE